MPMHDWTKVDAGVYHVLHHDWITEIHRAVLKRLPAGYYSMPEQKIGAYGPDVLALSTEVEPLPDPGGGTETLAKPKTKVVQEFANDFYVRKKNVVAIRHASGDRLVAVIEIVSPGNKSSASKYGTFVQKARTLLENNIHLLIVDPFPPTARHPYGLHFDIVEGESGDPFRLTREQPLNAISYECDDTLRAYVEPFAVGDRLADMPVYLIPGEYVNVPLEETYMAAWASVPPRWQAVVTA